MSFNQAEVKFERLTELNFHENSLDSFVRHQDVTQCWRKVEDEWQLLPVVFTEEWDLEKRRSIVGNIAGRLDQTVIGYGAFVRNTVVGYIIIGTSFFGSRKQYLQLEEFQVSEPYRGRKIGKRLFELGCNAARELKAEKLYISSHSSRESQAAYRAA